MEVMTEGGAAIAGLVVCAVCGVCNARSCGRLDWTARRAAEVVNGDVDDTCISAREFTQWSVIERGQFPCIYLYVVILSRPT